MTYLDKIEVKDMINKSLKEYDADTAGEIENLNEITNGILGVLARQTEIIKSLHKDNAELAKMIGILMGKNIILEERIKMLELEDPR